MTGALACWFSLLFGEGRGNFVGGLAAILVCMVLGYHHYRRQVAVALLLLVATIALAVASNARIVQKKASLEARGDFFNGRITIWKDAYAIWRSAPLLGVGPGEMGKVSASRLSTMRPMESWVLRCCWLGWGFGRLRCGNGAPAPEPRSINAPCGQAPPAHSPLPL